MTDFPFGNIFENIPALVTDEAFSTLYANENIRVERIISNGQSTPENVWYDQKWDEWILLLDGSAELLLEGETGPRRLLRGDYMTIPARCRHRVVWTDPAVKTVWLAIHISEKGKL